jgi:hypothetical protein
MALAVQTEGVGRPLGLLRDAAMTSANRVGTATAAILPAVLAYPNDANALSQIVKVNVSPAKISIGHV